MTTLTHLLLAPLAVQLQRVVTPFGRSAARSFGTLKQLDANFPRTDACRRSDGQTLEGVHADPGDPLMERVLHRVPELARWEDWYRSPLFMRNGHVHTIFAAKTRRTRAVRYHRLLVPTPDGGTLAELHFASNSARATLVLLVEECESHPILSWPAQSFNFRGYLFRFAHCADSVPLPCQRVLPLPQVFNVSPQPILQDILQWSPALIFKTSFRAMHCSTTTSYPSCGYSLL